MLILLVRLFNILIPEEVKRQILLIKLERLLVMSSLSVMELIKMFQKLFMLMSDFGDVTLANEEDLEQSGLEEESHEVTVDGQHQSQ